jgi:hypothetical protein
MTMPDMPKPSDGLTGKEAAEFIRARVAEAIVQAKAAKLDMAVYLLEMAFAEADEIVHSLDDEEQKRP